MNRSTTMQARFFGLLKVAGGLGMIVVAILTIFDLMTGSLHASARNSIVALAVWGLLFLIGWQGLIEIEEHGERWYAFHLRDVVMIVVALAALTVVIRR